MRASDPNYLNDNLKWCEDFQDFGVAPLRFQKTKSLANDLNLILLKFDTHELTVLKVA
jgi:hypothetical protein